MISVGKQLRKFKLNFKVDEPIKQSSTGSMIMYSKSVLASSIKQEFVSGKLAVYSQFDQNSLMISDDMSVADAQLKYLIGYVEEFAIGEDNETTFTVNVTNTILPIDTEVVYAITFVGTDDGGPVRIVQNAKIVCLVLSTHE